MGEEKDLLERVSTLEVQIKDITEIKSKIDVLYNLIVEMKLQNANTRSDFATKQECRACQDELEKRLEHVEYGRKKLFWAAVSSGFVLVVWLVQQLLHISINVGG